MPDSIARSWQLVALSKEVRGKPLARKVADTPVVLFRGADGRIAALLDRCPHRGVALSLGLAEPNVVKFLEGMSVRKVIIVPGKIINIVAG